MAKTKFERITRPLTAEEKSRHAEIRERVMREFPPAEWKLEPLIRVISRQVNIPE